MSLEAQNISVVLAGKTILSDITLKIHANKCTAIVGTNGAGKSTLLRALAGLLPVVGGKILLDDQPIGQINRTALARRLAILPQTNNAPPDITVERLVGYGRFPYRKWWKNDVRADRQAVENTLKQTGLYAMRQREVHTLSGGERQRAYLAMALTQLESTEKQTSEKFLLLDEPTTYLDIAHQAEVMDTVTRVRREKNITAVMVVHDLNHALKYADEVVLIHKGSIYRHGAPREIICPDILSDVFGVASEWYYNQSGQKILGFGAPV